MNAEWRILNDEMVDRAINARYSFFGIPHSSFRIPAFTLVELMVVITLMSLVVGMTVFRLDDVTTSGRLRSSASRIASTVRLAQNEARTLGSPRQLDYDPKENSLVVRKPQLQQGHWQWDEGREVVLLARIDRILKEGGNGSSNKSTELFIGTDGRLTGHAVVLESHDQWCVIVIQSMEEPHYYFMDHRPKADEFASLIKELEAAHVSG